GRGVHRMVELLGRAGRARHHPAGVEEDLHALLALGLVLDGDRTAAPRGRRPRDRTWIVVGHVLAEPLEDRARAGDARAALAGVVREAASQRHFITADLVQVRVDVRGRRRRHAVLQLDEVEWSAHAQVDVAELERAAVARARAVHELLLGAGRDREREATLI